jgi:flagellar biosynthesis protein FlhG
MTVHPLFEKPRLTAIGSGKGGTGKTTIAVQLAHSLAALGERVLLCDADFGLSNTSVQLGLHHGGDFVGVMSGTCEMSDAVVPAHGGAKLRGGFDLLAPPSGSGVFANAGAKSASRLVAALRSARSYDRVLVDLSAGVDSAVMTLAAASDETVLVLTPDPSSLTDAYAFAKLLLRASPSRPPEFVVNLAASEAEARRAADAFAATCRAFLKVVPKLLGTIPRDSQVVEAMRRQASVQRMFPDSPAVRALAAVGKDLHARIECRLPAELRVR